MPQHIRCGISCFIRKSLFGSFEALQSCDILTFSCALGIVEHVNVVFQFHILVFRKCSFGMSGFALNYSFNPDHYCLLEAAFHSS